MNIAKISSLIGLFALVLATATPSQAATVRGWTTRAGVPSTNAQNAVPSGVVVTVCSRGGQGNASPC